MQCACRSLPVHTFGSRCAGLHRLSPTSASSVATGSLVLGSDGPMKLAATLLANASGDCLRPQRWVQTCSGI